MRMLAFFVAVLMAISVCSLAHAGPDLGAQVRDLFQAHCTECHGAQLAKPKGKFGYVTDLIRLVAESQVEPGQPGESELYKLLVTTDEKFRMPPAKAKAGQLKPEEIELVKAWIQAGAPAAIAPPSEEAAAPPTAPGPGPGRNANKPPKGPDTRPMLDRVMAFGGKFHPVVVHFPIALLMVGAFAEVLVLLGKTWTRDAARLVVPLGAISAVVATVLGLLSADAEGYATATIFTHRLLGIIASGLAVTAFVLQMMGKVLPYRLVLFAAASLTGLAGHFGGGIVYGADHFDF